MVCFWHSMVAVDEKSKKNIKKKKESKNRD